MTNEDAIKFANCLKNNYTIDIYDIADFCDMVINALEIVEEFERARIITGGRLNGRTYAYKCGLEDGKRKALEQQTINYNATTEEIAQSFKADVEAVKDYLPKCNLMEFPKTFDEFANDYGFTDDKEIYTNGSHLIPVFRVKQWLDHIEQQHSDCVSRKAMLNAITEIDNNVNMDIYTNEVREIIKALPPVTPTHGTCKNCEHWKDSDGVYRRGVDAESKCPINIKEVCEGNFYCKDFEKRGREND